MEEAIAAGVLLPDGQLPPEWGGPRQRDFGEKPSMWQVSLGDRDARRNLEKWQGLAVSDGFLATYAYRTLMHLMSLREPLSPFPRRSTAQTLSHLLGPSGTRYRGVPSDYSISSVRTSLRRMLIAMREPRLQRQTDRSRLRRDRR